MWADNPNIYRLNRENTKCCPKPADIGLKRRLLANLIRSFLKRLSS